MNGMVSRPLHGLSLCAGGGGLDLGVMLSEPGYHTRAFVEWEDWPRSVLIAAQRDAIAATANANGRKAKRQIKCDVKLPLSDDEKAAFYAKMVNADGYLPQSVISNTIRDAMLGRGLVTPERLRMRGVR